MPFSLWILGPIAIVGLIVAAVHRLRMARWRDAAFFFALAVLITVAVVWLAMNPEPAQVSDTVMKTGPELHPSSGPRP